MEIQVYFDPGCEGELCISQKGNPEAETICFDDDDNLILEAQIWDTCPTPIKKRNTRFTDWVDMEENIQFYLKATSDDPEFVFPLGIFGYVISCGIEYPGIYLPRFNLEDGTAEYKSGFYMPREFAPFCDGGRFIFEARWGRVAKYSIYINETRFRVNDINFSDDLQISSGSSNPEVCYPFGGILKLGTNIEVMLDDWPSEASCQNFNAKVIGISQEMFPVVMSGLIEQDSFLTNIVETSYQIDDFFRVENLDFDWTISVENGPERDVLPSSKKRIKVYHGFMASPILFFDSEPPHTIMMGDVLQMAAIPYPYLDENQNIKYTWFIDDQEIGHFNYGNPTIYKQNTFIPDQSGTAEIYYKISHIDGQEVESAHEQVIVKPGLVIDYPEPDCDPFIITAEPQMPQIACKARIEGIPLEEQENLQFNWTINFEWSGGERFFTYEKSGSIIGADDWIPDFGNDFAGGKVKLTVTVIYQEEELTKVIDYDGNIRVWAQNPSRSEAESYLIAGYTLPERKRQAVVIAQKESNTRQFTNIENCNYGTPKMSFDSLGVGMMQITNPQPVPQDFWNWRANVNHGKEILQQKWDWSDEWFEDRVLEGYPEPTEENKLYNTYCKYNGGNYYSAIEVGGDRIYVRNKIWRNQCGTGECTKWEEQDYHVLRRKCLQSGCCYADKAMDLH